MNKNRCSICLKECEEDLNTGVCDECGDDLDRHILKEEEKS